MGALNYFLVVCFSGLGFLFSQEPETIPWSGNKLTWKDFKGSPPSSDRVAATTASGISYEFSTSGTKTTIKVDFKISTYFYSNESWYKPELCDSVILNHEQLHFDISELFARKLRREFSEATFTHENVKRKIRDLYRKNNKALNDFQNQYDAETNFSRNRDSQRIWNEKIKEALISK